MTLWKTVEELPLAQMRHLAVTDAAVELTFSEKNGVSNVPAI